MNKRMRVSKVLLGKKNNYIGLMLETTHIGLGITIDSFKKTDPDFNIYEDKEGILITIYLFCFQILIAI